ncbi:MAG TPA: MFS transporter [Solirubrobacterales bacterium]|nr:MFS transporter [Solirubrobacterales bacterium]
MAGTTGTPERRGRALLVASAGYFFVLLDVTIVNVALAAIGGGLGASRSELQWVVDAYALVLAAFMLGAGDLADRLGARRLFVAGLALFGLGSLGCAAAPAAAFLVGARVVQGLGAAAILPTSLAIVNQLFPDEGERPRAIGVWAALGGTALVAGPIVGGLLVDPFGWRAIFWLNLPLVLAALGGALAMLPAPAGGDARRARQDVAGQVLGTIALLAAVFALIEGGRDGFLSPAALAGAAVALAALLGFLAAEHRAERPLLEPRWFRRPEFAGANAGAALMNLGTLGGLFAISLYLQQSRGLSPLQNGLALVPLAFPLAALTPFTGRLVAAVGPRWPAGLGLLASGLGYAGLAVGGGGIADDPAGWALLALAGTGMALAVPGLVAGATEALGPDRAGIASAINNTSRQIGGAIGVALIGGFGGFSTSLAASAAALLLGGLLAMSLMGGSLDPRTSLPLLRGRGSNDPPITSKATN